MMENLNSSTFLQHASIITDQIFLGSADAAQCPVDELKAFGITHILIPAEMFVHHLIILVHLIIKFSTLLIFQIFQLLEYGTK